jgi:hypothetical protein
MMPNAKEDSQKQSSDLIHKILKTLILFILTVAVISTIRSAITPLLPTASEYEENFPGNWDYNISNYPRILLRHLGLFTEYFNTAWLLGILGNVFFLFLILNVKGVIDRRGYEKKPTEAIKNYLKWALGSLLISSVIILGSASIGNIYPVAFGILGLALSALIVAYILKTYFDKSEN